MIEVTAHAPRWLLGMCLLLAACGARAAARMQADPPLQVLEGRLVDVEGKPLPLGTELLGRIEPYSWPHGSPSDFARLKVGEDGRFAITSSMRLQPEGDWLHLARTLADGTRQRIFVPARPELGALVLETETLLAAGRVVDEHGAEVRRLAVHLELQAVDDHAVPASVRLGARWVLEDGTFALWGFRVPGNYRIGSSYVYDGPSGAPVALELGAEDLLVILPATGYLQLRLQTPRPFPERCVFAVVHDLVHDRTERRWLIPSDTTNMRLRLGRYRVHCELNGVPLTQPQEVEVEHLRTTVLPTLDLRASVRVLAIEALDPEGEPIPAVRVRVLGSDDPPASRQRARFQDGWRNTILVATADAPLDLELTVFGSTFEPLIVKGVDDDMVVTLRPRER